PSVFYERPISLVLLIATVGMLVLMVLPSFRRTREEAFQEEGAERIGKAWKPQTAALRGRYPLLRPGAPGRCDPGDTMTSARLQTYLCLNDFERAARRRLPRPLFGYIAGASETNASLRYNAEDFDAYAFQPRVLRDVSGRSTATTLLGETYDAPFG